MKKNKMEINNSLVSPVTVWQMTPEELEAYRKKYPPKLSPRKPPPKNWRRINKDTYIKFRKKGYTKAQIMNRYYGMTLQHINACLERWGINDDQL